MDTAEIQARVERLAEELVLADTTDLPALAEVHSGLQQTGTWAAGNQLDEAARAAEAAAALLEKVILSESSDPAEAMRVIGATVNVFQTILRQGPSASPVTWPAGLGLESAPKEEAAAPAEEAGACEESKAPAMLEGDKDLLQDFVMEAREHLDNADVHLLTLESDPHHDEAMNAVFRAFHTIKGVAGFLALDDIQALAHEAENLLDKARKNELSLVDAAMDITFEAVDMLKRQVGYVNDALTNHKPLEGDAGLPGLAAQIKRISSGKLDVRQDPDELPPSAPEQKLGEILMESTGVSPEKIEEALALQQQTSTVKPFGELVVEMGVATPEQVEEALKIQQEDPSAGKTGEILSRMGILGGDDIETTLKSQAGTRQTPKLGEVLVKSGVAEARDVAQALRSQRMQQGIGQAREPVKVDAERLDQLVDAIGELVIAESMVSQSAALTDGASTELARYLAQLDKITRELQEMGMSLRMVPIRSTFQKMARLVRDLAKKAGKQVDFNSEGDDTELDKTVIDKIGDPLIHMVRNAVDHGLEASSEDRVRQGKPAAGRVTLRAFHKGGNIYVEIEDDGRGLNPEAILAKARERNLIAEGETLAEREIWNLIFLPGFSTAQKVTDVSGRGVGMDVVKKNIEALRGEVEIHSEPGKGTKFMIRLPLTMAIIDGMVVRVGTQRYIIPTLSIITSLRPSEEQVSTVVNQGEMLKMQGRLLPLFRLERIFDISGAVQDLQQGIVVVVEADGKQTGVLVDDILGQQQIVIKSLGETLQGTPGLAGGAIMPDGTVGLILDIAGLVKLAKDRVPGKIIEEEKEDRNVPVDEADGPLNEESNVLAVTGGRES
jgi:two-component system, chemotaxis family, sensor kinase CheA